MFNYDVHSQENNVKQNFGQKEQRNDDNEVTGEWWVPSRSTDAQWSLFFIEIPIFLAWADNLGR